VRPIVVTNVALLFAGDGSPVAALTVATFAIVECGMAGARTRNVAVMVTVPPAASVPSAQGNPPAHVPDADTNVVPAGAGSASTTAAALTGPAFVTVSV